MARPLVRLRRDQEKETVTVEVVATAPQVALNSLMRTVDGMALRHDELAIEAGASDEVAEMTIVDSSGFPLFILKLRGDS